jgi:hypothetical protein
LFSSIQPNKNVDMEEELFPFITQFFHSPLYVIPFPEMFYISRCPPFFYETSIPLHLTMEGWGRYFDAELPDERRNSEVLPRTESVSYKWDYHIDYIWYSFTVTLFL